MSPYAVFCGAVAVRLAVGKRICSRDLHNKGLGRKVCFLCKLPDKSTGRTFLQVHKQVRSGYCVKDSGSLVPISSSDGNGCPNNEGGC